MFFEDARARTLPAVHLLESQKDKLGCPDLKIWSLVGFNEFAGSQALTRDEKEIIVDQAILLIDQFYAHLPFKRARYAADPVQSLRLVQAQLDELTDIAFHEQMIQALIGLRDAHTFYGLPAPYQGAFAFLPFRMQCFYEKTGEGTPDKRRYIVTHVMEGFDHELFTVKAEITSWNGIPTEQAVERESQLDPGANPSSRFARSMNRMCILSLALSLPPAESFVVLGYIPADGRADEYGIVMPWYIGTNSATMKPRQGTKSSLHESMAQVSQARRILYHRAALIQEAIAGAGVPDLRQQSKYPLVFSFQYSGGAPQPDGVDPQILLDRDHPGKQFGYIKIRTFDLDPADPAASNKFVAEFERIARLMQSVAPDGLILDVRSNPGGSIDAAERSLQFLTPRKIKPADFHFISSRLTQQIATVLNRNQLEGALQANQLEWLPWLPDLLSSVSTGSTITQGWPLTSVGDANDTGQIYQGPVTLIIDALAYSATDIFSAGFQDHKIGSIIGVDANTGGGGANRWLHDELWDNLKLQGLHDLPLQALPGGAQLGLAIRRSSRVGVNAGRAIEDQGVTADLPYQISPDDLLHLDQDLLAFACRHLGSRKVYALTIDKAELTAAGFDVSITTRNLFRLECLVNNCIQCSVSAADGQQSFRVATSGLVDPPERLQINGFASVDTPSGVTTLEFVSTVSRLFEDTDATLTTAGTASAASS